LEAAVLTSLSRPSPCVRTASLKYSLENHSSNPDSAFPNQTHHPWPLAQISCNLDSQVCSRVTLISVIQELVGTEYQALPQDKESGCTFLTSPRVTHIHISIW
jgi:hypothetical protein